MVADKIPSVVVILFVHFLRIELRSITECQFGCQSSCFLDATNTMPIMAGHHFRWSFVWSHPNAHFQYAPMALNLMWLCNSMNNQNRWINRLMIMMDGLNERYDQTIHTHAMHIKTIICSNQLNHAVALNCVFASLMNNHLKWLTSITLWIG